MFKIEEKNDKYYVVPTAEYLLEHFDKFSFPYDSNWEIYKLFKFPPKDLFDFLAATFDAKIIFQREFPYVSIYFHNYVKAEIFKKELEQRANTP